MTNKPLEIFRSLANPVEHGLFACQQVDYGSNVPDLILKKTSLLEGSGETVQNESEKYTRNGWRRSKITLETSGED